MTARRTLFLTAIIVGLVALPATAQVAHVSLEANGLALSPLVEYRALVLTVSGGGDVYQMEFGPGEEPFFALFDDAGYPLADDSYTWELKVMPATADVPSRGDGTDVGITAKAGSRDDLLQNGYFFVRDGAMVTDVGEEPPARLVQRNDDVSLVTRDQIIADDLIVQQSLCVGQDCVNGESFGFDTIRLKENNLRIKFQDTSNSASFPSRDWQITANESTNGGANKFSIEDIDGGRIPFTIEAAAPSHSLYVDDGGRIGLGTSTPVVEVHIVDGDTPTLRLEQDGSSGFTPQTWDVAGNETNFFVRDATNGSQLPFKIRPSAPSNSLYIDTDGDVGFGTTSPEADLHITASGGAASFENLLYLERVAGGPPGLLMTDDSNDNGWQMRMTSGGNYRLRSTDGSGVENMAAQLDFTATGNLTINGTITTSGSCSGGCDLVFDEDYDLPSIEDHAAEMFANRHLPSVGPTPESGPFNLSEKVGGMLNELEKAHIYIDQLHRRNNELEERLAKLEALLETEVSDE